MIPLFFFLHLVQAIFIGTLWQTKVPQTTASLRKEEILTLPHSLEGNPDAYKVVCCVSCR